MRTGCPVPGSIDARAGPFMGGKLGRASTKPALEYSPNGVLTKRARVSRELGKKCGNYHGAKKIAAGRPAYTTRNQTIVGRAPRTVASVFWSAPISSICKCT